MPSSPNGSPADNAESNKALLEEIGRLIQLDDHQGSMEDERSALVTGLNLYQPGTLIGHFKIVRRLGEGGFAEVFEATQEEPVRRRVALKVMKTGNLSLEGIARFEVERQTLAVMGHPNIATVHEAGTTPFGQPYFAMEYVEGTSITDFCREQQLSVQDKIKLLIQVSLAIHHAHQKGIIHRDLKPATSSYSRVTGNRIPRSSTLEWPKSSKAN